MEQIKEYTPTMTFYIKDLTDEQLDIFVRTKLKSKILRIIRDENNNSLTINIINKAKEKFEIKIKGTKYNYNICYSDLGNNFSDERSKFLLKSWRLFLHSIYGNKYDNHIFNYLNMIYQRSLKYKKEHNDTLVN